MSHNYLEIGVWKWQINWLWDIIIGKLFRTLIYLLYAQVAWYRMVSQQYCLIVCIRLVSVKVVDVTEDDGYWCVRVWDGTKPEIMFQQNLIDSLDRVSDDIMVCIYVEKIVSIKQLLT